MVIVWLPIRIVPEYKIFYRVRSWCNLNKNIYILLNNDVWMDISQFSVPLINTLWNDIDSVKRFVCFLPTLISCLLFMYITVPNLFTMYTVYTNEMRNLIWNMFEYSKSLSNYFFIRDLCWLNVRKVGRALRTCPLTLCSMTKHFGAW